ncbi:MAG: hypothetical protein ACXAE3_09830, partial [Candidatus Kariarchaeaceae archaeon]
MSISISKISFFISIFLLLLLPGFVSDAPLYSSDKLGEEIVDTPKIFTVDIGLEGQIYLSQPNPRPDDEIDIYTQVRNHGTTPTEILTHFTVSVDGELKTTQSTPVIVSSGDMELVSIPWTAEVGLVVVSAEVEVVSGEDVTPNDNSLSTSFTVEEFVATDIMIDDTEITISKGDPPGLNAFVIQGKIQNNGPYTELVALKFTDTSVQGIQFLPQLEISLDPFSFEFFSVPFTPSSERHFIEIVALNTSIFDSDPSNNRIVKEFQRPQVEIGGIEDELEVTQVTEISNISPGGTQVINFELDTKSTATDYQVIVGGITHGVEVTPNKWKISLSPAISDTLEITVKVSEDVAIGEIYPIHVLLYAIDNPSDIMELTFDLEIVEDDSHNFSTNPSFYLPNISTDELNPPSILSQQNSPLNPTILQNVTISAELSDDIAIDNATLYYSFNEGVDWSTTAMAFQSGISWAANISTPGIETSVLYYVNASDTSGNFATGSQESFTFDGTSPSFYSIPSLTTVSSQNSVLMEINVTDNVGVDTSQVFLYYSFDNSSFFSV